MNINDFEYIKLFVKNHTAIELEAGKEYLIESRLAPIVRELGKSNLEKLIYDLKEKPTEALKQRVIDAITTNETLFFRDIHPFELLKKTILPCLMANRKKEKKLVVWCAAASSGQEPYTIAIILKELGDQLSNWTVKFIASDISEKILLKAKEGIYSQLEVNRGLPLPYLLKYFDKEGPSWRIKKELKDMVEYQRVNIVENWPLSYVDLVFIRNILIYFNLETKKGILDRMSRIISKDGYLFLGGSETMLGINSDFERLTIDKVPYYQLKK